jgi:hypothetical protein
LAAGAAVLTLLILRGIKLAEGYVRGRQTVEE